jgi:hypothetical protein
MIRRRETVYVKFLNPFQGVTCRVISNNEEIRNQTANCTHSRRHTKDVKEMERECTKRNYLQWKKGGTNIYEKLIYL